MNMMYAAMIAGRLGWNLEQRVSHRAGEILQFTVSIENTTGEEREFQVWIGLFTLEGSVITTFPLPDTFTVAAGATTSFNLAVKIDYSNCILQASLYDIETGEMGAALQTTLEQPPSLIDQVSSPLVGVAVVGMMGAFIPKILKD
jgi:urea transporter